MDDTTQSAAVVPCAAAPVAIGDEFEVQEIAPPGLIRRTAAWLILLFLGSVWGITFSLAKIATDAGGHPLGIAYWQTVIGAGLLIVFSVITRRALPMNRHCVLFYMVCAVLGTVVPGILLFYAASRVSPGVLSITIAVVPLVTFVAAAALRVERVVMGRVFGVVLGALAIVMLVGPAESMPDRSAVPWVLAAVLASLCYAAENMVIAMRMPKGINAFTILAGMFIAATLMMTPAVIVSDTFVALVWPWGTLEWTIIALALITTFSYGLFIYLITLAGPVFASQTAYLVTLSGVFWGIVIFDEQHSFWIWLALAVMMLALVLVTPRKKEA